MRVIVPDYYKDFSCIAGKCSHSCCIGWEIDIDDETLGYYNSVGGEFGRRLREGITAEGDGHCFKLSADERCPFLNRDNLCDIITELGEDSLCSICADHPRYRNFFSDRTELGLGLCCEAAAELILMRKKPTELVLLSDDGESCPCDSADKEFFLMRERLFEIIKNRRISVRERISKLCETCGIKFLKKTPQQWADIYSGLERLDDKWTDETDEIREMFEIPCGMFTSDGWEIGFEQLLIYFLYRHMADGLYDGRMKERISFGVHALYMICLVCAGRANRSGKMRISDFTDAARMYSSEIEYSEDNMNALLEILGES